MRKGKIKTWRDFLSATGGSKPLSRVTGVERNTILEWYAKRRGVPEPYWQQLIDTFGLTADELLALNQVMRSTPIR